MQGDLVVVFGGSGFIGTHVVKQLAKRGKRIRVPMRRPHLGHELRVLGDVGQVQLVQANVRFPESVERALEGANAVVNLVGLLFEKGSQKFDEVQAEGAATIAEAAKKAGVARFVQVSAIGADANGKAKYARTKAAAEEGVRARVPTATVVRPSIVFGPEDQFFNRFADMAKFAPALPLIGGGKTKFQPVYVQDVAEAIANALDMPQAQGKTYELGGPGVYSFKELLQFTLATASRKRGFAHLPFFVAGPMGSMADAVFKLNPFAGPPLTGDQVAMLKADNIVSAGALTIKDLGVTSLESIETIVPTYLWRFRPYGQFQAKTAG
jgi:uncharacterized protein YbjT (DUF2867 family)